MNRLGAALGWSIAGWIGGALIGAAAGFVLGVVRIENVAQAALAGAGPVGLIGALGAFSGSLLQKPAEESVSLTGITIYFGAMLGALTGAAIGKALGADIWLLESLEKVDSEPLLISLHYHIDLFGGPHVVVGTLLGILAFGALDIFLGSDLSFAGLLIAALLSPVVSIIAALVWQIDWGAAVVIVVATTTILYVLLKTSGGSAGSGTKVKGKAKA